MSRSTTKTTTSASDQNADQSTRPLAVITGASSGIGYELAKVFAKNGFDLLVAAEDPGIAEAAAHFKTYNAWVDSLQVDLATKTGVEQLYAKLSGLKRPLDSLVLNAGVGAGGEFKDIPIETQFNLLQLNVVSPVHLAKLVVPDMVHQGHGRIMFTSSIAAEMPGPYYATYAASKAFLQSFAEALRFEVKERGITVTALQPGATDTNFFQRAHMMDTKAGVAKKDSAADVAQDGFNALMAGKDHVVAGSLMNTVQATISRFVSEPIASQMHAAQTKPGSAPSGH